MDKYPEMRTSLWSFTSENHYLTWNIAHMQKRIFVVCIKEIRNRIEIVLSNVFTPTRKTLDF